MRLGLILLCTLFGIAQPGALEPATERTLFQIDSLWATGMRDSATACVVAELEQDPNDVTYRGELLLRRGSQGLFRGDALGSEKYLQEALSCAQALADSLQLCRALRWLSLSISFQGRYAEATELFHRLLTTACEIEDTRHEGWGHVGLAGEANRIGDRQGALDHFSQAAELFRSCGETDGELWAENGLGIAFSGSGELRTAREHFLRVADLANERGNAFLAATALNNLGTIEQHLGDPGRAQAFYEQAYQLHQKLGQVRESLGPQCNLAECQILLGRYREAEGLLEQCLAVCDELGYSDHVEPAYLDLGFLYLEWNRPREALRCYRVARKAMLTRVDAILGISRALPHVDSLDAALAILDEAIPFIDQSVPNNSLLNLLGREGQLLLELDRPDEALRVWRKALKTADALEIRHARIRSHSEIALCHLALGHADSALSHLEQSAALWEVERDVPYDPVWREARGATARFIYTDMAALLLDRPGYDPRANRRETYDRLQLFKARTLQERMTGPEAGLQLMPTPRLVTLEELQTEILKPGELLLDFYLGPRTSLLFAVSPNEFRVVRLPGDGDLTPAADLCRGFLHAPATTAASAEDVELLRSSAHTLSIALLGDVTDLISGAEHVILSPDGMLHAVPLAVLPGPLERVPRASRVPSSSILAMLRRTQAGAPPPTFVALAGEELRGAVGEVAWLARTFREVECYIIPRDSLALARDWMEAAGLLHLASHLEMDDQNPWRSALRIGEQDLRAADIAQKELSASLAVLANCESASGRILDGEGVLGLAGAFLSAGVPAVVATLWPVDDEVTAQIMKRFYKHLAQGFSVTDALRAAQHDVRARQQQVHPFYWAGFVVIGDGDQRIGLQRRERPFTWAGGVLAAALVLWFLIRRNRK